MRVWDIPVEYLCDKHLLAQHLEVHTIYNVITKNKRGYSQHPETLRWVKHLPELVLVHNQTAHQMVLRGFNHKSPLDLAQNASRRNFGSVDPIWRQIHNIYRKGCNCNLDSMYQWYDLIGKHYPCEGDSDIYNEDVNPERYDALLDIVIRKQ